MFRGLVESVGTITSINQKEIVIKTTLAPDLSCGDSVAVNGVCLTVTKKSHDGFCADISPETFSVTALGDKKTGEKVNLERALTLNSRLDGHLVYGHIDSVAKVSNILKTSEFYIFSFSVKPEFEKYLVKKGSIAVDGISLTIADVRNNIFDVAVIPHTYEKTVLSSLKCNDCVNIEFDIIVKYLEKRLSMYHNSSKVTLELLEENGFV